MDMKHDGYNKYQIGGMVKVYVRNTRHRYHNPLHNDVMGTVHLDCHYQGPVFYKCKKIKKVFLQIVFFRKTFTNCRKF